MLDKTKAYRLMPWAWLVAWMLTGLYASILNTSSLMYWSIAFYIGMSAVGWAVAGFITLRASRVKSSMTVQLLLLAKKSELKLSKSKEETKISVQIFTQYSVVAWVVAYLVAVPLGLVWMLRWDMGPFLLFVPVGLAGAIGGIASSARSGPWRWVSGAIVGLVFYIFSTISFYAGYILILFYSSISTRYGFDIGSSYALVFVLPQAVFGLGAGFMARWILGIKAVDPKSISDGLIIQH